MKPALLLAMIPLALMGTLTPEPRSPWTGPTQSPIAAQAGEVHTFVERWWPGDASFAPEPLTFEQRWAPVEQTWGRRVRTIPITKSPPGASQEALEAIATAAPLPRERPAYETPLANMPGSARPRPRPIRVADICARHGMHKQITNGGKSWRCRK